jgi:hypothetical protein
MQKLPPAGFPQFGGAKFIAEVELNSLGAAACHGAQRGTERLIEATGGDGQSKWMHKEKTIRRPAGTGQGFDKEALDRPAIAR